MSRRFQFSMRALLMVMLLVAVFFGGMAVQRRLDRPQRSAVRLYPLVGPAETITLPDGTVTLRKTPQQIQADDK